MSESNSSRRSHRSSAGSDSGRLIDTAALHNPVAPVTPDLARSVSLSGRILSDPNRFKNAHKVGRACVKAIPGYAGFIPGKVSECVVAASFSRANTLAQHVRAGHRVFSSVNHENPLGLQDHPGRAIPGYKGFIAGRDAENVIGETFKRANELSTAIKRRQYNANASFHSQQIAAGERMFGPRKLDGNAGFYPLYRSLMRN